MTITGIIAEYNPFHNGHHYHLQTAREETGADYIIVVMSGNYTQRGYPAIIDKHTRAKMALLSGADLVLELPLLYATGSAEYFAGGAVFLLDALGVVTHLCFGSEQGSLPLLSQVADMLLDSAQSASLDALIGTFIRDGHSYPKARSLALDSLLEGANTLPALLAAPNNILSIEYLKAIKTQHSPLHPVTIKRQGAAYHDGSLTYPISGDPQKSSASAIRNTLQKTNTLSHLPPHLPASTFDLLSNAFGKTFPLYADDFSLPLHYKLLAEAKNGFTNYLDVSPQFSDKIQKNLNQFQSFEQFCSLLKTKDITHTRISRSLLHILLDLKKHDFPTKEHKTPAFYANVLGFRKSAIPMLHSIKSNTSIPLLSKLSSASTLLDATGLELLEKDIFASHLYQSIGSNKFKYPFISEYKKQIVII